MFQKIYKNLKFLFLWMVESRNNPVSKFFKNPVYPNFIITLCLFPSTNRQYSARPVSYASAAASSSSSAPEPSSSSSHLETLFICPYYEKNGECYRKDTDCPFAHGDHCDMCNQWSLHPFSQEKKKQHQLVCPAFFSCFKFFFFWKFEITFGID